MWTAVVLSGAIGFVYLIAITASAGNLTKLTHSSTPVADVVIRVLGGVVGKLLLILVAYSIFACGMVIFVSASRMVWAMSRDARFPGYTGLRRIHHKRGTPMAAALLVGLLIEVVLLLFSHSQNALFQLFSAATLMPCLIYLSTVILYVATRHKLPQSRGFHLGPFEIPVIVIALVWLLFELSIFRDASFHTPWIYTGGMLVLGLIYLAVLLLRRHSLVMPTADTTLDEVSTSDRAADSDETEHS
jgi:amino acid transporter